MMLFLSQSLNLGKTLKNSFGPHTDSRPSERGDNKKETKAIGGETKDVPVWFFFIKVVEGGGGGGGAQHVDVTARQSVGIFLTFSHHGLRSDS